ncbi:MAG: thiamine pyrophosphate-binding protein [Bacteroidales bacterium]|nr:thiamine pyrophosphate-binding protein [Bacteroidales bacterium]
MKVTTFIANFFAEKKIDIVFELQGGMITRIIDEIHKLGSIKIVSMHHEQAASFAADAFARITNKPAVAMATSGPGATNLITGIGSCYFDSVPAIFITGQVNISEQKGNKPTRQIGFQETDIISIVKPITKAAYKIESSSEIPAVFADAYDLCLEGRPGPVLIDIPMDVQNQNIAEMFLNVPVKAEKLQNHEDINIFIKQFKQALLNSKKPLCLVGRGIRVSGANEKLLKFVERYNIPLVSSLLAVDAIPYDHPLRVGFIGTYGNRWANWALGSCDLLLVMGSRLDLRQTGIDAESFKANKTIFHIDIDSAELNNRITDCVVLNEDLKCFLDEMNRSDLISNAQNEWLAEIKERYAMLPDTNELKSIRGINPNEFLHLLSQSSGLAGAYTTDVGNNQMWAAQSIEIQEGQHFLSCGGMGAMGYSLPAAIGAAFALPATPIVSISGDGGFQINIQELQTIVRNNLPVKIIILNNHCLGMIRQFQDAYFDSVYQSTVWGYTAPDFVKVASAYGIDAISISQSEDIDNALQLMWKEPLKPFLLNVEIDIHTNVYPKMMYGSPITKMEPPVE